MVQLGRFLTFLPLHLHHPMSINQVTVKHLFFFSLSASTIELHKDFIHFVGFFQSSCKNVQAMKSKPADPQEKGS